MSGNSPRLFGYAEVESALGKVFVDANMSILALRGRLKAFQRAGLTPESPGRGKVIKYSVGNVYNWALALALADFGITPEAIVSFVKNGYLIDNYLPTIAKLNNDNLFLCLLPYALNKNEDFPFPFLMIEGAKISASMIAELGGRAAFVDLSRLKMEVDDALMRDGIQKPGR
jgi:hypothetical protein